MVENLTSIHEALGSVLSVCGGGGAVSEDSAGFKEARCHEPYS